MQRKLTVSIRAGELFIHPTDTIYGIGCDATNAKAVDAIRKVKQREDTPFSVIAPSKDWIRENCEISERGEFWLDCLPGPYTLIFRLKKEGVVAPSVNLDSQTLGVRMPKHWFTEVVRDIGIPLVTTSANIHGKDFMTSLETLHPDVKSQVKFLVYEGEKRGRPSTLVDLTQSQEEVIRR